LQLVPGAVAYWMPSVVEIDAAYPSLAADGRPEFQFDRPQPRHYVGWWIARPLSSSMRLPLKRRSLTACTKPNEDRMKTLLVSLLVIGGFSPQVMPDFHTDDAQSPQPDPVVQALHELELALDAYFELLDQKSVIRYTEAVAHSARGRILLEQYLGDDVDNWSPEFAMESPTRMELALIAAYAERFAGENAIAMFGRDRAYGAFSDAKQELAEWDVMVQGAISRHFAAN